MENESSIAQSIRKQAAETLLRARKVPRGPYRNDLRQLGTELLRLHKRGLRANELAFDLATEAISAEGRENKTAA